MLNNDRLKLHNEIIKKIASEKKISIDVVERIIRSQWEFIYNTITNTNFEDRFLGIKIKYLGLFGVSNLRFKNSPYNYLYVPKEHITPNIDPRKYGRKSIEELKNSENL